MFVYAQFPRPNTAEIFTHNNFTQICLYIYYKCLNFTKICFAFLLRKNFSFSLSLRFCFDFEFVLCLCCVRKASLIENSVSLLHTARFAHQRPLSPSLALSPSHPLSLSLSRFLTFLFSPTLSFSLQVLGESFCQ